ncbi:hypothetical protein [Nonomuraea glycinis]|uniref:hypothetical protein n=1 Tax=Nonomuraea glycinis TaxID=2047744 RepID=UPI002E150B1D|nr:hypothetical protein OHA68_07770 [Nonomuraea glycinis]
MLKTSHICDWFEPYDDSDPLVIVITHRSGDPGHIPFEEDPGLWEAFHTTFGDDREINTDGCLSDYVYEVARLETDITSIMKSPAHWLRVTVG